MAADQVVVPNPPYKEPMLNADGRLTQIWVAWFRQVYLRVGGSVSLSNEQIVNQFSEDLAALDVRVDENESDISSLTTLNELNQAPVP